MQEQLSHQESTSGFDLKSQSLTNPGSEERDLLVIGERLERELHRWNITVIPASKRITEEHLRTLFPIGPIVVCDVYVEGIETGIAQPWGYEKGGIINIDHHAPTPEMARPISSGNLAGRYVTHNGPVPADVPLIINHTDCDSIISSLVTRGLLPVHAFFERAVIAADHTGAEHRAANLLQGLEDSHDAQLAGRELAKLLKGEAHSARALKFLADRERERTQAAATIAGRSFTDLGPVVLIKCEEKIGSEIFLSFFPNAALVISTCSKGHDADGRALWDTKLRLGPAAPDGLTLSSLGARTFDSAFGGRWNAGSTGRGGGTLKTPEEYLEYYAPQVKARIEELRKPQEH